MNLERGPSLLQAISAILVSLALTGVGVETCPGNDELPRKIREQLQSQIYPAMVSGNDLYFCESFSKILRNASPARMQAIEDDAAANQLPSPAGHFLEIRLMQMEQGLLSVGYRQPLGESVFLVDGINQRLEKFIHDVGSHTVMSDPLQVPEDWKESRDLFWELHVFKNESDNAFRLVEAGAAILEPLRNKIERGAKPESQEVVRQFESLAADLPRLKQELLEREAELRLIRFNQSYDSLAEASDFETRLTAAMSIELDGEVLIPFLAQVPSDAFTRAALQQPQLLAKLREKREQVHRQEPEVVAKARLFREGMHWWLRGRYGQSSLANGLLKPELAMTNPALMNALYMPRNRSERINASEGSSGFERRHFYSWAVEYRPLISAYSRERTTETRRASESRTRELNVKSERKFNNEEFFY